MIEHYENFLFLKLKSQVKVAFLFDRLNQYLIPICPKSSDDVQFIHPIYFLFHERF